jgi:hypothetical protein
MDGVLKKGVGLLLILFLGFWLVQDPNGFADSAENAGSGVWGVLETLWEMIERLFGALLSFINSISD